MHDKTACKTKTFDCTVDGIVPDKIKDRTTFHKICLIGSKEDFPDEKYVTFPEVVGDSVTPDYLKVDIEVKTAA